MKRFVIVHAALLLAVACAPSQRPPAQKDGTVPPDPCAQIVPAAQKLAAEGWGQQALDLLNARCPGDVAARALILARMGRVKEAEMLLADMTSGGVADARQLVARAKQEQKRRKIAGGASEQHLETARQLLRQEKCDEAVTAAERAIRSRFPSPEAWFQKARAYSCLGEPQEARLAFERGVAESQEIPRWLGSPGERIEEVEWVNDELFLLGPGANAKAEWRVHRTDDDSWRLSKGSAPAHVGGRRLDEDLWISGGTVLARAGQETVRVPVGFQVELGAKTESRFVLLERKGGCHNCPLVLHIFDLGEQTWAPTLRVHKLRNVREVFVGGSWIALAGSTGDTQDLHGIWVLESAHGTARGMTTEDSLRAFGECRPSLSSARLGSDRIAFLCSQDGNQGLVVAMSPGTDDVATLYSGKMPKADALVISSQGNRGAVVSSQNLRVLSGEGGNWKDTGLDFSYGLRAERARVRFASSKPYFATLNNSELTVVNLANGRRELTLDASRVEIVGMTRSRANGTHTWVQNCNTMLSLDWFDGARVRKLEGVSCSNWAESWAWWSPPSEQSSGFEQRSTAPEVIAGDATMGECGKSGRCSRVTFLGKSVGESYRMPIGLSQDGRYGFFTHARKNTVYSRRHPEGPILHEFPLSITTPVHVINVPNSTKALLWTDEGWRLIDLTDKPGRDTSKLVQYSSTAQDITADMKLTVGAEGLCDEQGRCTPLEGLKNARTRQGNEQPVVVSTKQDADPDSFETVLRFAADGKLVTGTSPRQLHVWDAASGRYLGKYVVSSVGTWFFVGPGSGPQEERGIEVLNANPSEQETGLSCTVGDEWFPWEICEAHFRRDLLDESGLPHSVRRLLQTN